MERSADDPTGIRRCPADWCVDRTESSHFHTAHSFRFIAVRAIKEQLGYGVEWIDHYYLHVTFGSHPLLLPIGQIQWYFSRQFRFFLVNVVLFYGKFSHWKIEFNRMSSSLKQHKWKRTWTRMMQPLCSMNTREQRTFRPIRSSIAWNFLESNWWIVQCAQIKYFTRNENRT